jgi:ribonuclease P protein component
MAENRDQRTEKKNPSSAICNLAVLRKRPEFLAIAANNRKCVMPGLILQQGARHTSEIPELRYGLTASRKVGNAVTRNRARRRLRALAQAVLPHHAAPGYDYVLIARTTTPGRNFAALKQDLMTALGKLGAFR